MKLPRLCLAAAAASIVLTGGVAIAQQGGSMSSMSGMDRSHMQNMTPTQREMMEVMQKMDRDMMQGMMDPDPGQAWMKSMAAHHQGAIDMSVMIQHHTKNPKVLAEARKTAAENRKSLAELRAKM